MGALRRSRRWHTPTRESRVPQERGCIGAGRIMHKAFGLMAGFVATIAMAGTSGGGHAGGGGAHGAGGGSHGAGGMHGSMPSANRGSLIETLIAMHHSGHPSPQVSPKLKERTGRYARAQTESLPLCSDEQRRLHRCDDKGLVSSR